MKIGRDRLLGWGRKSAVALGLSAIGLNAVAQSSQSEEARASRLVLSAGAAVDDDGETFFSTASVEINRETRTQALQFVASADVDFGSDGSVTFPSDPRLSLSYSNTGSPLVFSVGVDYSETELDGLAASDPDDDTIVASDFVIDGGTRISRAANASVTYGTRGPFGATLAFGANDLRYIDATDPRLFDRTGSSANLDFRFDVSRVLQVTAGLGFAQTDNEDSEASLNETRSVSLGFVGQATKVITVDGGVSIVETTEEIDDGAGGRLSASEEGWAFNLGATLEQRRGNSRFSFAREIESGGRIDRISYQRNLDVSRTQRLSFGFGGSQIDGGDATFEANINFAQSLKNGDVQLSARQTNSFTSTDDPVTTRQLTAQYSRDLSRVSRVSADVQFSSVDYRDGAFEDSESIQIGVGYTHTLTKDWDVSARTYLTRATDADDENEDIGLSVQINRSFDLFN